MITLFEYINKDISPLKSTDRISEAQDLFAELTYSHFPVSENGIYIGCIRKENAELLNSSDSIGDHKYEFNRFYVRSSMIWLDVLEVFAQNETNIVPVLDDKNNYLGYYELEDVVRFFHETPFLKEDGGILVIQKDITDYSMSQVAQIVESNNAKLLGVFVSKISDKNVEITLKISQSGLNDIIQSFRRYEYEIISEHQEDNYLKNLKDRSDYLDKYLNI